MLVTSITPPPSATVTSLQARVEGLATTNALMKEDLSISRSQGEKVQGENRRLRQELEKLRVVERRRSTNTEVLEAGSTSGAVEKKTSVVQASLVIVSKYSTNHNLSFSQVSLAIWYSHHDWFDLRYEARSKRELVLNM